MLGDRKHARETSQGGRVNSLLDWNLVADGLLGLLNGGGVLPKASWTTLMR